MINESTTKCQTLAANMYVGWINFHPTSFTKTFNNNYLAATTHAFIQCCMQTAEIDHFMLTVYTAQQTKKTLWGFTHAQKSETKWQMTLSSKIFIMYILRTIQNRLDARILSVKCFQSSVKEVVLPGIHKDYVVTHVYALLSGAYWTVSTGAEGLT